MFPGEPECIAYIEEIRWPNGFACPMCGISDTAQRIATRPRILRCRHGLRETSLTAETVMHATRTSLQAWFLVLIWWRRKRLVCQHCSFSGNWDYHLWNSISKPVCNDGLLFTTAKCVMPQVLRSRILCNLQDILLHNILSRNLRHSFYPSCNSNRSCQPLKMQQQRYSSFSSWYKLLG